MDSWRFKLLYDGECPLCAREVRFLQKLNRHGWLVFEDIAAPGFDPAAYSSTREELMGVIHGVFPDGRLIKKMAVFREAYRAVGFGWLLAPTGWPVLRCFFDLGYEWFARNRMAIGRIFDRTCESGICAAAPAGNLGSTVITLITVLVLTGAIELWMGRSLLGPAGKFGWWEGNIWSSENSQRFADPYSFSHLVHGMLFYAVLWLFARKLPVRIRLMLALAIEAGWEILENSPIIINRYREATISLGYAGDSVLNSLSDILMMTLGFLFASRVKPWIAVVAVVLMEVGCGIFIRDNLTLNIIMLIHPVEAIKHWQMNGAPGI